MIPSYWYSPEAAIPWQIVLHSFVAATALMARSRRVELPHGKARRHLLCAVLVVPIFTALVPGRYGYDFREQLAWFDSARFLSLPLVGGMRMYHAVLAVLALTAVATLWQELMPVLKRVHADFKAAPESICALARSLPAWGKCRVGIVPDAAIFVATNGWPGHPRLILSEGSLDRLCAEERQAVVLHENAHWRRGRWVISHLLFALRILQFFNPVALWAFREYSIEVEIDCDADAAANGARPLIGALLKVYGATGGRELAVRSTLRTRVDILLRKRPRADVADSTVAFAVLVLVLSLPWIV